MTDFTSQITAWYEAVQFRAPPADALATFNATLNSGSQTEAQVQTAIISDTYTLNIVDPIIREYQAAFGRVPDQAGLNFWVNQFGSNPNALNDMSTIFANSAEFNTLYGANATTTSNTALVTALYTNVLGRAPDAAGLAYWAAQPLNASQLLQAFAQSPEFITDTTNSVTAFQQQEIAGTEPTSGSLFGVSPIVQGAVLTTGLDNVTAQDITGTLTQFLTDGKGPTFNSGDAITGSQAASKGNQLSITDQTPGIAPLDSIPAGVSITNIQTITLNTNNNALNWDTTPFVGVLTSTVTSSGAATDLVKAAATTDVTVNHTNTTGGGVTIVGGNNVTVNGGAFITVGNDTTVGAAPAGTVNVTQTSNGTVLVEGGTDITIKAVATNAQTGLNGFAIQVGDAVVNPASAANPTGTVSVTDSSTGGIAVFGGTDVSIQSAGGVIKVGDDTTIGGTVFAPTGNVTIKDTAATLLSNTGGNEADITVIGGATINVTTNTGGVTVGDVLRNADGTGALAGENPTGDVTVTDTATKSSAGVGVAGGANVTVTASGLNVIIGGFAPVTGTEEPLVVAPTGAINVTDNAATALSDTVGSHENIRILGGTDVTVTTNTASVTVGGRTENNEGTAFTAGQNPTGDVNITDAATADASVRVYGGDNVTVQASGLRVSIGADEGAGLVTGPTGTVTVTDTAATAVDGILNDNSHTVSVIGGTTVNVTTNVGSVRIGTTTGDMGANPTGAVTVTDTATSDETSVTVRGGTDVNITTAAGDILVGAIFGDTHTVDNPTGTVTINEAGINTGAQYNNEIEVGGGTAVTINTTGASDGIGVGTNATPVTGAVVINDTYAGMHSDSISVVGGTTVTITTTPDSGNIDVGQTSGTLLNAAGTGLASPAASPSGNVVIVNSEVDNGVTTYGTSGYDIVTNGATSVALTGGTNATITDVESTLATAGPGIGKAVGTSTLSTVSLAGFSGGLDAIHSDALANLSLTDFQGSEIQIFDNTANAPLAIALNNVGTQASDVLIEDTGNHIGSVTVTTAGTAADVVELDFAKATSLTLNNATTLVVEDASDLAAATSITAQGSGTLILGDVSGISGLAKIDASTATGAVDVEINPGETSFAGGSGNDVVDITSSTIGNGVTINGGSGTNILYADFNGTGQALGNTLGISNFQTLGVVDASGTYDASGFQSLAVGQYDSFGNSYDGVTGSIDFTNVSSSTTTAAALTILADANVTYELKTDFASATPGSLTINIGQDAAGTQAATTGITAEVDINLGVDAASNEIGSLTINTQGTGTNVLDVDDGTLTSVTITGDGNLTLQNASGDVKSVDASASSGKVDVTDLALDAAGVTITGGAGAITASGSLSTTAVDVFNAGSGGGTYNVGGGGSWNGAAYDNGSETINLGASLGKQATINLGLGTVATNNGAAGGVNGFQVSAANNLVPSDALQLNNSGVTVSALSNVSTAINVASITTNNSGTDEAALTTSGIDTSTFNNLAYTVSNGVITFAATGTSTLSQFTQAQLIAAAELIVTQEAELTGGANEFAASFVSNGNTFVVVSDANSGGANVDHIYGASVVELDGVTASGGFGTTQASNTVVFDGIVNQNADNDGVSTGTHTYNDTGFSADSLDFGGSGVTNTFSNLAASAQLDVSNAGDHGNVVTTQVGGAGTNSLTLNFLDSGNTIDTLTVNGDGALYIDTHGFTGEVITSLVDPGNTLTTLNITGGGDLTIGGITDTALTKIDAHTDAGTLALTANQDHLTILGSTNTFNLTANGAGDTITVGTDTAESTGLVSIHAQGAGDTITQIGGDGTIAIDGTGATITLADTGSETVSGTGSAATGANATINFGDAAFAENNASAFVGSNSTVNFVHTGTSGTVDVHNDVTGAASSGSFAFTTINGLTDGNQLTLNMGETTASGSITTAWAGNSAGNSQVNVAGATSLAGALDMAVHQASVEDQQFGGGHTQTNAANTAININGNTGLVDWFQYQGNTYVVEAVNNTSSAAAHSALDTHDIVVKLTGLVDVTHATVHFS